MWLGTNGIFPVERVLADFSSYAYNQNYSQILFEFGKQYLEVLLTFHESREEYEICSNIIKQVEKYNRNRNENIKLEVCHLKN